MQSAPLHHSRYNASIKARALIVIWWSTRPLDRRASIKLQPIRRLPFRHVSCILNKDRVELSPTREKLKEASSL